MSPMTRAIVVTTINRPTRSVKKIATDCQEWHFIVVGDKKTPADWDWPGVQFLSFEEQLRRPHRLSALCPPNHYARKNLGYLEAMSHGAEIIAETDDDNIPYDNFLQSVSRTVHGAVVDRKGWDNVYTHFTDERVWPRGLPLEEVVPSLSRPSGLGEKSDFDCVVQQYLADGDPDVDAVYRLTTEGEIRFSGDPVVLSAGTFCPFNSQNTVWWPEAFPLLYLPSHVSFRVTDIWRAFIAQACLYAMGAHIAFCPPTVLQVRNEHSLIRDFADEIPGYLNNPRIMDLLAALPLSGGPGDVGDNLRSCYEALVKADLVPAEEIELLDAWLGDVAAIVN